MPPKASLALLFHPKKNTKQEQPSTSKTGPPKPRPKTTPVVDEDEDGQLELPDGPYQEFRLLSSALNGWKYDVMKFDSRKQVDIMKWAPPIKLNRKDLRREDNSVVPEPQAVAPMLGPDGKPVVGADGKVVMVDAEGRPIHSTDGGSGRGRGGGPGGRKRFQKKTRQVFYVPDEVRQLRREERYPWVIEDSSPSHNEMWIGQMEEASKSDTHAFFMPAANDAFKFVPAHRWYKFQKRVKHDLPTDTANVESLYTQSQKRDPQLWLATLNGGRGASSATAALFKAESEGRNETVGQTPGQSLGPGGRKLKTVDSGTNSLFDDDDEEGGSAKRRDRELGGEGDHDEQVYEEDFADDEETMEVDDNDEEAKELEERIKREYKMANKQRDAGVDESEEEDEPKTSKQSKALQKMIRNREGNDAYESEEDKNPYASSEEEEEEELPAQTGPAIQSQPQQVESRSNTPKPAINRPPPISKPNSRATSPVASPGLGGHSLIAKRATSPKAPKVKASGAPNVSRGNTPPGSRANSPTPGSRATSPLANSAPQSQTPSNVQTNGVPKKRKADDSPTNGVPANNQNGHPQKLKKKKTQVPAVPLSATSAELEALLIGWLQNTPSATTRDCIQHFTPYLTDQEKKSEFSGMVRRVAYLKNGVLALRAGAGTPSAG